MTEAEQILATIERSRALALATADVSLRRLLEELTTVFEARSRAEDKGPQEPSPIWPRDEPLPSSETERLQQQPLQAVRP